MDTGKTRTASITATILLVMMVPAGMNYVSPLLAQSTETGEDTSSASQDYQEFQSCLSDGEVGGTVSEQQIRDCFAPIYNTGTGTGTGTDGTTIPPDSTPSDEDTTAADDTSSEGEGGEEASE
ncbi:MAG: hypothetical protein GEU26_16160 [Nitrososphaeraceae archaeon]|nr:hypothetical protein [Nitrososphaeraceae archaeon]